MGFRKRYGKCIICFVLVIICFYFHLFYFSLVLCKINLVFTIFKQKSEFRFILIMEAPSYITCTSTANSDIYFNTPFQFKNLLQYIILKPNSAIALYCLDIKNRIPPDVNLINIKINIISSQESGKLVLDDCVANFSNKISPVPIRFVNPVYFPLELSATHSISEIRVKLEDLQTGEVIQGTKEENTIENQTLMTFHIKQLKSPQKLLHLSFKQNIEEFKSNTPFSFNSIISPIFHDNLDFTKWELSLDTIYFSSEIHNKIKAKARCLYICSDVISDNLYDGKREKILEVIPVMSNKTSKVGIYRKYSTFYFTSIEKRILDKIKIWFLCNEIDLSKVDYTQEEIENGEVIISLILRKRETV